MDTMDQIELFRSELKYAQQLQEDIRRLLAFFRKPKQE
jgi:hypothetical protein